MKKYLLLIILFFFIINKVSAQSCPTIYNSLDDSAVPFLQFTVGTTYYSASYPDPLLIMGTDENSTPVEMSYIKGNTELINGTYYIEYDNPSPSPYNSPFPRIDPNNFTLNLPFGDCLYINQVLPVENYFLDANDVSLFPKINLYILVI